MVNPNLQNQEQTEKEAKNYYIDPNHSVLSEFIQSLTPKKIGVIGLLLILIFVLIFGALNMMNGWSRNSAVNKINKDKINQSNEAQFLYGFENRDQTLSLLKNAETINPYAILGLMAGNHPLNDYISKNVDVTSELKDAEFLLTKNQANLKAGSCLSLLGFTVMKDDLNLAKFLIENGKISNPYDCALSLAIEKEKPNFYKELYGNKKLLVSNETKRNLIKNCYTAVGVLELTKDYQNDIFQCNNKDLHKIYIDKMDIPTKDSLLIEAVQRDYDAAATVLVEAGANSLISITKDGSLGEKKPITRLVLEKKQDNVSAAIIRRSKEFPKEFPLEIDKTMYNRPIIEYLASTNMPKTLLEVITQGYDYKTKYQPIPTYDQQFPAIFALFESGNNLEVIKYINDKEKIGTGFEDKDKNNLLALAIDKFNSNPQDNYLENVKILIDNGFDINSKTVMKGKANFFENEYPVWAVPFYENVDEFMGNIVDKRKPALNKYFDLISLKNPDINIDRGQITPMYTAVTSKSINLARYLLDKGFDPNTKIRGSSNQTALNKAIANDDLEMIKLLISRKTQLNKIIDNKTYLMSIMEVGNITQKVEIIKLLKDNGAEIKLCVENVCPKDLAVQNNQAEAVQELVRF